MKKIILSFLLLVVFSFGFAVSSISTISSFSEVEGNPAVLANGNYQGLGYDYITDEDFESENWSIFLYSKYFGYRYNDMNDESRLHLPERYSYNDISFLTLQNSYSLRWYKDDFKDVAIDYSLLYRPVNSLSFGLKIDDIFDVNMITMGLGIRPFWGSWRDRVTVGVDVKNIHNDINDEFEMLDPLVSIQTEILNGVKLDATYDLETETTGFGFGFNFNKLSTYFSGTDSDEQTNNKGSVFLSSVNYRSLFKQKQNKIYKLKMSNSIVNVKQSMKIGHFNLTFDDSETLESILKKMEKIEKDDRISTVLINNGNISTAFANFKDLENGLHKIKKSGKKIYFYFDNISSANYCLAASTADKILLNPNGTIDLKGLSATMPYFKDLLDTLGVEVTNFRSHKYKTAMNTFSENHMTDAEKESMQLLIDDLYNEMVNMIATGRKDKLSKSIKEIIDEGPFMIPQEAKELGLVDELVYEYDLKDYLGYKNETVAKNFARDFDYSWDENGYDKIAIIYAEGSIHMGRGQAGRTIGSKTLSKAIKKAREDKTVKGIILRVNSGGGSAQASDIIAQEIKKCNSGLNRKPVVVSMGGAAASGGYFISAYADKIVAQPNTITGSIGVVGALFNFEKLFDKIHINWETVKQGKNADIGSIYRPMNKEEYKKIEGSIKHTYDQFINVVAEGREMDESKVREIAQGRVWSGTQAYKNGLVDELGGLETAIEIIKKEASLKREPKLFEYSGHNDLTLNISLSGDLSTKIKGNKVYQLYKKMDLMKDFGNEKALYISPHILTDFSFD